MKERVRSDPRTIVWVAALALSCFVLTISDVALARDAGIREPVWIVLFASQDCPRCEAVKELLSVLGERYPVRIKAFDVGKASDYRLFRCLERIHSDESFAVPLIMVGETVLMGDRAIAKELEKIVDRLALTGGSPLPYLGSTHAGLPTDPKDLRGGCNCDEGSRPPTLGEELRKIRGLLNRLR